MLEKDFYSELIKLKNFPAEGAFYVLKVYLASLLAISEWVPT